jgi:hypothetical protein
MKPLNPLTSAFVTKCRYLVPSAAPNGRKMRPYKGNSLVEIDWLGYTALAVASGVSTTDITLVFDHEHCFDIGQRRTVPTDWALGG